MDRKYLSMISLAVLLLVALAAGIFLINQINETYSSPEFQTRIVSAAAAYQDEISEVEETEENEVEEKDVPGVKNETKTVEVVSNDEEERKESVNYPKIKSNLVSWGHESRSSRKIDTIIIHSVYDALHDDHFDLDGVLDEFKEYGVSSHYIIERDGDIYQLVQEKDVAYHAGQSQVPDGRTSVNQFSLGIELINDEDSKPTKDQYKSLKKLVEAIKSKYSIKYVLGHSDIAPGRKTDPWNFDWSQIK